MFTQFLYYHCILNSNNIPKSSQHYLHSFIHYNLIDNKHFEHSLSLCNRHYHCTNRLNSNFHCNNFQNNYLKSNSNYMSTIDHQTANKTLISFENRLYSYNCKYYSQHLLCIFDPDQYFHCTRCSHNIMISSHHLLGMYLHYQLAQISLLMEGSCKHFLNNIKINNHHLRNSFY